MVKSASKAGEGAADGRSINGNAAPQASLKPIYDFIVCGAGSSGSVVARRLAEVAEVSVLLLEAGGSDECPSVLEPGLWRTNLGTERDWAFAAEPNPNLNGRVLPMSMGKVLGGGSSINVMVWARGHRSDWDYFAAEAGDAGWRYESVLQIYRRIEDWGGAPDPAYRGVGGPVYVQPAPDPNPIAPAMVEALRSLGVPTFEKPNGLMMEGEGGASLEDLRIKDGKRQTVSRSYLQPYIDRPNLTVLTGALVTRLMFDGRRASGVQAVVNGRLEVMPGPLSGVELEQFVRDGTVSYSHQSCTAKMGRDPLSVVDGQLRVYGINNLRVADASILPRVTTGNAMAPCVIIGERAGDLLKARHGLSVAARGT